MTPKDYIDIILFIAGLVLTVIGYLISKRVDTMSDEIKALQLMHVQDVAALEAHRLKIAENYLPATAVEKMFNQFRDYLDERFNTIEQIARYSNGAGAGVNETNLTGKYPAMNHKRRRGDIE